MGWKAPARRIQPHRIRTTDFQTGLGAVRLFAGRFTGFRGGQKFGQNKEELTRFSYEETIVDGLRIWEEI